MVGEIRGPFDGSISNKKYTLLTIFNSTDRWFSLNTYGTKMRESVTVEIQLSAVITIPSVLEVEAGLILPINGSQPYLPNGTITFSLLSIDQTSKCTQFKVNLATDVDLPKDLSSDELLQIVNIEKRKSCDLFFPLFDYSGSVLDRPFELYFQLKSVIWKLVFSLNSVRFIQEFDDTKMADYFGPLTITCKGMSVTSDIPKDFFPKYGRGLFRSATLLTRDKIEECLSTPLEDFELNCVFSDIEYSRQRPEIVVSLLVTMLETEAYKAARKSKPTNKPSNFSPDVYLSIKNNLQGPIPFEQSYPQEYIACQELWGARHEVVHHDKKKIRPFLNGKFDKVNLRDLTAADISTFRAATLSAISWLRNLP